MKATKNLLLDFNSKSILNTILPRADTSNHNDDSLLVIMVSI